MNAIPHQALTPHRNGRPITVSPPPRCSGLADHALHTWPGPGIDVNAELGEEEDPRSKSDAAVVAYDGIGCNRDVLPLSSRREW